MDPVLGSDEDFCRADPELIQSSAEPIPGAVTITGSILVQEKRTSSTPISSSFQVPPAAAALVPLTLCKKPKDYSNLQVPRVWKTANPDPNLGTLSSLFHGKSWNSPEKILISGVFQSPVNASSAFVFLIIPASTGSSGDFSTCSDTLPPSPWMRGCSWRDGSCGADSSEHLILQERRAKSFSLDKKQKGNLRSWSCSEGEMRQHLWAQRAGNTKIPFKPRSPKPWKQVGPLDKRLCCFQ